MDSTLLFFCNYIDHMPLMYDTEHFISSDFVKPICLPYEDDVNEDYLSSEAMKRSAFWVAGWGATTMWGNSKNYLHNNTIYIYTLITFQKLILY